MDEIAALDQSLKSFFTNRYEKWSVAKIEFSLHFSLIVLFLNELNSRGVLFFSLSLLIGWFMHKEKYSGQFESYLLDNVGG